jgi:hypothetical protein
MAKKVLKYRVSPALNGKFHFFASSIGTWMVGENLDDLVAKMKRDGLAFNVFYVPVPKDSGYEIRMYAPKVEGAVFIGYYGFDEIEESEKD